MTSGMRLSVRVPATSANLGPGFDCMGLALQLFNQFELTTGHPFALELEGESASLLPTDRSNVVVETMDRLFDTVGSTKAPRAWQLKMVNRIPVGSGLGSSAAAIVGGLLLANELLALFDPDRALTAQGLLQLATAIEGHPDNVTPALQGGACLSCPDGNAMHTFAIPIPTSLHFVVAVPYFALYTEESRKVVPQQLARADVVFNVAQAARLTLALTSGNLSILRHGFGDKLHEPYREPLIIGYAEVKKAALRAGALAVTLSGAGPSMLGWCDEEHVAWQVADQMTLAWREHGIPCRAEVYQAQPTPTQVITSTLG